MPDSYNPLVELAPARYRKIAYGIAALALLVISMWQASDGDWVVFVVSLLTAVTSALAFSNTNTPPQE